MMKNEPTPDEIKAAAVRFEHCAKYIDELERANVRLRSDARDAATLRNWSPRMPDKHLTFPWKEIVVSDEPMSNVFHERTNQELIAAQQWKADPVFLDIGAHQGFYATFLAKLAGPTGRVIAFEPDHKNVHYLRTNTVPRPGVDATVEIMPYALGSKAEIRDLFCWNHDDRRFTATGNSQLITPIDRYDYKVPVNVWPLDHLALARVDFIKIDVEHWELEVMKGAMDTITRCRPRILIEVHDNILWNPLVALSQELGMAVHQTRVSFQDTSHGDEWAMNYLFLRPQEEAKEGA